MSCFTAYISFRIGAVKISNCGGKLFSSFMFVLKIQLQELAIDEIFKGLFYGRISDTFHKKAFVFWKQVNINDGFIGVLFICVMKD